MPRTVFLLAILLTLLVAGCSSNTAVPLKTDLPPLESEWTVRMTHSGGIMGLSRSIEVSSDGKYTVTDERANKIITRQLSANELSKLWEIVSNTEYISPERTSPSGCADCFIYDLEIHSSEKNIVIQLNDISLPESDMEPLITYLRGLLEAALK